MPRKSRSLPALVRELTAQVEKEPYDRAGPALCIALILLVTHRGEEAVQEIDRFAAFMQDQVWTQVGNATVKPHVPTE
jgi:hypothetical protein